MEIATKDKREVIMKSVYDWASLSKDPRTKIGAVIVEQFVPISAGYNNFPRKVADLEERYNNRELKYKFVVHAEANAILNAARLGRKTEGATMYTQGMPCAECMKSVINSGISKIICHKQWPELTHSEVWVQSYVISKLMMQEAGVEFEWFDKVLGKIGYMDGKDIEV